MRRVDDRPYGGGPGMVLLAEPLVRALAAIRADRADGDAGPAGALLARRASGCDQAARRRRSPPGRARSCCAAATKASTSASSTRHVDLELSLGDFVLSGGELPALVLLDAVARLQPGVLGDARSHEQDSFSARAARLPALQPAGELLAPTAATVAVPAGAAVGQPRGDRALAPRPGAGG